MAIFGQKWAFWAKRGWKGAYFWPKWPETCFIDFLVPKPLKMMGHMIKFARISKNGFLGRFGTVRPKFWALTFFSGLFVKPAVKHNGNELEYAKSAKSNVVNLRKLRKMQFLGQFGPNGPKTAPKSIFWDSGEFYHMTHHF